MLDYQSSDLASMLRTRWVIDERTVPTFRNSGVPNDCNTADDADHGACESNRFRTPHVAVEVRPNLELDLEEEQVGFQQRLVDLQTEVDGLLPTDRTVVAKLQELQRGKRSSST